MATVPIYSAPTVSPSGLPGVRQSAPDRLLARVGIGAAETKRAGDALTEAGGDLMKKITLDQIERNEAKGKEYDANAMGAINAVLYGTPDDPESGYMSQKGKTAVDAHASTVERLNKIPLDLAGSLDNPAQERMVKTVMQSRIQSAIAEANRHMAQQSNVYQVAAGQTRIKVAQEGASASFNPLTDTATPIASEEFYKQMMSTDKIPSAYQNYLQTIVSEAKEVAKRSGVTEPDLQKAYVSDALNKAYMGVLGSMLTKTGQGAVKTAREYFDKVKGELTEDQREKVTHVLDAGQKQDDLVTVIRALEKDKGSFAAKREALGKAFDAKGQIAGISITGEIYTNAKAALEHDEAKAKANEGKWEASMLGQAQDWLLQNPGKTVLDLPRNLYVAAMTKGHLAGLDAFANRQNKANFDDSQAFVDLVRMSTENPSEFSKMNLPAMRAALTDSHFNHVVNLQAGINRGDARAMEVNKLLSTTLSAIKADLKSSGFDTNPKKGSPQAKNLAALEAFVHDQFISAQSDWEAKKSTPAQIREEARKIALGALKDHALSNSGYFFDDHMRVYQMTPEQRAAPWTIPATERKAIEASLKAAGLPATEANIQRAFKAAQGVR